jgi:hypothetical protein
MAKRDEVQRGILEALAITKRTLVFFRRTMERLRSEVLVVLVNLPT